MKIKKYLSLLLAFIYLTGCASVHNGLQTRIDHGDKHLILSLQEVKDFSDEANVFINVTIENTGMNWMRIKETQLRSPHPEQSPYNVIAGSDLVTWKQSLDQKIAIREQNNDLADALGLIAGIALLVAGASSKNNTATGVGALAYTGALAHHTTRQIKGSIQEAEVAKQVPENHLMAEFAIPAKGFAKKWLLINIPKGRGQGLAELELETLEGEKIIFPFSLEDLKNAR